MTFIAHCTSFDNSHTCQGPVITHMPRSCHNTHDKALLVKVQTLMYTPHTTGVQSYWMSGRHLLQIIVIYSTCDQQVHELCVDCKRICESHGISQLTELRETKGGWKLVITDTHEVAISVT